MLRPDISHQERETLYYNIIFERSLLPLVFHSISRLIPWWLSLRQPVQAIAEMLAVCRSCLCYTASVLGTLKRIDNV
ncbi:MAG: hypothetical protein F6J93_12705 [Oscillatoria sp. SIO1A7]|nr:hypothetical protein [Oscillatoria sp. SIO1A7]